VLADPASQEVVRRDAEELRLAARAHLPVDAAARIEEHAAGLPLAAFLSEL
jgi:hypothetical protein